MNWKQEMDAIIKKYDQAKDTYNERVLKDKRKEYKAEAQALVSKYRAHKKARLDQVTNELKNVAAEIEKAGKAPIFNFEKHLKFHEVKGEFGTVLAKKQIIDTEYIEGVKYLTGYMKKTLSRLSNVEEYRRAIDEVLNSKNEQALHVLHDIVTDGYYPSFVDSKAVEKANMSRGARAATNNIQVDASALAVKAIHDLVADEYKKATYPPGLYALEQKQQKLQLENMRLRGFTFDDTESYLTSAVTKLDLNGFL